MRQGTQFDLVRYGSMAQKTPLRLSRVHLNECSETYYQTTEISTERSTTLQVVLKFCQNEPGISFEACTWNCE